MDDIFTSDRTSGSQNLNQFGHALLRQTLNKDDLSNYGKTVENYFKDFDRRRNIGTASEEEIQMYDRYGNFCLTNLIVSDFCSNCIFDLVANSAIPEILEKLFNEKPVIPLQHVLVRKYHAINSYQNILPFHQDIQAVDKRASVTSWIPFNECGTEAPGLELVGKRVTGRLPTSKTSKFNLGAEITENYIMSLYQDDLIHPTFSLGDAILFLNTTPHRSYVTPAMSKPRYSVEIRYMPGSLQDETDSEIYNF